MAPKGVRRGVLMTATARKSRASWRDEEQDEASDGIPDSDDDEVAAAKSSQLEWENISREVREERRKKHAETNFAMGKRDVVLGYDDVADDAVEPEVPRPPPGDAGGIQPTDAPEASLVVAAAVEGSSAGAAAEAPTDRSTVSAERAAEDAPTSGDRDLPPEGAITAGQQEDDKAKKVRGGKRKPGSQKKRERADAAEGGDGEGKKRRRKEGEDADDGKWLKCKLEGDEKTKRIKASRVVYYHDFDSGGALLRDAAASMPGAASSAAAAAEPSVPSSAQEAAGSSTAAASPAAAAGNFRSTLRWDLWDDDSEE